jgi:hypothetical protein
MTNHHTKFEVPMPKRSLIIDQKPNSGRTDGQPDNYMLPRYFSGRIIKYIIFVAVLFYFHVIYKQISAFVSV